MHYKNWCARSGKRPMSRSDFIEQFDRLREDPEMKGRVRKLDDRYFGIGIVADNEKMQASRRSNVSTVLMYGSFLPDTEFGSGEHHHGREYDAMSAKYSKATDQVDRAHDAISEFRRDGINADGVLLRPHFQAASLKVAREELSKAIAIIERTKW
jgi:hypothetical protein